MFLHYKSNWGELGNFPASIKSYIIKVIGESLVISFYKVLHYKSNWGELGNQLL